MLCRDRPELTRQAIMTMAAHAPANSLTITVVDDGSQDDTRLSLERFALPYQGENRVAVIRLYPSRGIVGLARNLGILASERIFGRGEYLYLSDSDAYFLPGWLDTLTAALTEAESHGIRLLGGTNHPFHCPNTHLPLSVDVRTHNAVQGISHLMRWKTFTDFGPFDAHAKGTNQSEDFAFCRRIVEAGYLVGSVYPRCILNCGLLDSYGKPCVGYEAVKSELVGEIKARGLEGKVYYPTIGKTVSA
jgi:GT2 family glycosyltransferase